jgi:3-oxoacyl-[acyl-carrier protein] reductase
MQSMLKIDLSGHIAVITGASGDLGRVMVRTLAQCGASVAINYLKNKEKAESLQKEAESLGVRAITVQADVTNADAVNAMQQTIAKHLGDPDIIINNAVIQYQPWTSVLEQPLKDYQSQFDSCILHNVLMAKAFVPAMIPKRWGRVIGINTECAVQCTPGQSAYAAAKRGMDGVLRVLAREIGEHQITVNQIAPGWMISDRVRDAGTERQAEYEAKIPLRRRGTDQDIANAVAFLASDLAGYVTGAFLPVCGGDVMTAI